MQTANVRQLFVTTLLLLGAGAYALLGEPAQVGEPRWPADESVYVASPWVAGPTVQSRNDTTDVVTRTLRGPLGLAASLTIMSSQAPKLYASGAELPFVGQGFTVESAPPSLLPLQVKGVDTLIAKRGAEQWVVLHAYGERRGLLGNGPHAWALALLDGVAGRSNDFYKLSLIVPADRLEDEAAVRDLVQLAEGLFPKVAAWYAA